SKDFYKNQEDTLDQIKEVLKNPQDVLKSVTSLIDENVKIKKQIEQLVKEKVAALKNNLESSFQEINGIHFVAQQVDLSMSATKDLAMSIGISKPNAFVFLASVEDDMPNIHCYISKELVEKNKLNAGTVIKELVKHIDGNGGGQPFFASGKGKNVSGIKDVLEKVNDFLP
ncbi:MAG TPA: alanine--tRNA ligase, partial [Flavobacterium sp.]|nr:alanine--tRNA ligase [Flavobacterium sp.]